MRKFCLLLLVLAASIGAACSGATPPPQAAAGDDTCPPVSPGVCPEGCRWNGTECRKEGGVIIFDSRPSADAGVPLPTK